MKKAWFLIAMGLTLVGLGSTGLALFHIEMQRRQEESRAIAAIEAKRVEEQQTHIQELKKKLDQERSAALERRFRLLAEKRGREEEVAKLRREVQALTARVSRQAPQRESRKGADPSREPLKSQQLANESLQRDDEAGARVRPRSGRSLTLSVDLDPLRSPDVRIAHVHAGDKVTIRTKRPTRGAGGIYVGLSPLNFMAAVSPWGLTPPWAAPPSPVVLTVKDRDSFRLSPPASLGPEWVNTLWTREGAIMTIGVGAHGRKTAPFQGRPTRGGIYEIEVTIETANHWGIPPRSLL